MNRRGFLQAILAAGAAPALVRASSLMKIVVPTTAEVWEYAGLGHSITIEELSEITRRAFVPKLVMEIYNTSPLMSVLLANAKGAA